MPGWVIVVFLVMFAVVIMAVSVGLRYLEVQQGKKVAGAIAIVRESRMVSQGESILRGLDGEDAWSTPAGFFSKFNFYSSLQTKLEQSAIPWNPAAVVVAMILLGSAGAMLGTVLPVLVFKWSSVLALAFVLGGLPWFYVSFKARARMHEFEEQFPESLDFLARSLRAGHAFSTSLEMLAQESPPPLGTEFGRVFHENNLGASMDVALVNLSRRVPLLDVRFFVSSVMLQRETGGNLGEILTKLSYVIRERFRLKGQVKAASAHGRLTATILVLMPMLMTVALPFVAPGYLQGMAEDDTGQWMILGAILAQVMGIYFIRKIIDIKV